jgi:hypothetical protein
MAEALQRRSDVDVTVLALRADEHRSVPADAGIFEAGGEVVDVGTIGHWRDDREYSLDVDAILALDLDVIHVSYETILVTAPALAYLGARFPGRMAVTFHDNCIPGDFPLGDFDLRFTHRWNVGPRDAEVVPFGIEDRAPVVRTFGLGRTRSDYLAPICARRGWVFETAASHEPIRGGGQQWMPHDSLIEWLRGADLVALWYDPQPMAGSSQAARTAMAARRPLITNDTEWFSDLPVRADGYWKVADLAEFERVAESVLERPYVQENSWDAVAALLADRYAHVLPWVPAA